MLNKISECPICFFSIPLNSDIEESEIITCPECQSKLVVEEINNGKVKLSELPLIEEDWGE